MTPGVHPDGAIAFSVGFDKTNGFVIEQGQMGIIYATAVNGTAPYTYSWSCSLPAGQYLASGSLLRIENTAPPGNHSASVVATDSSMPAQMASNTVTFRITGTVPPPPIGPIVFNAGSGEFGFTVPTGYALSRVQGADTTLLASGEFNWTDLEPDVDYTEDAGQVTILTDGAAQDRMIRIWINPSP